MLFQLFQNVLSFCLKVFLWIVIAFAAIPFAFFVLFLNFFPEFTLEGGIRFWMLFTSLNIVAYYFLWKTIVWTITTITGLWQRKATGTSLSLNGVK